MNAAWEQACRSGDLQAVEAQLAAGAEVDALDRHGQSGLMIAAVRGHEGVVRRLIEAGAELDRTAKYRLSATMLAALNGHDEVAVLLAEAGADLTLRGSGAPGFADKTAADLARDRGNDALAARLAPSDRGEHAAAADLAEDGGAERARPTRRRGMTLLRIVVMLAFLSLACFGLLSSYHSYAKMAFHRDVEPDRSLVEAYQMELWLKLPPSLACAVASFVAARPLWRRRRSS